ncbi:unnamed protein product [Soboliphyme baturini]|uniref:Uncharacterized protein n=1 Tax=Soboliphyme baturini TaxID=241478 RepID=A0A183J735_9BILA|nr:unnamed protein product [Soboliphyme baturini]
MLAACTRFSKCYSDPGVFGDEVSNRAKLFEPTTLRGGGLAAGVDEVLLRARFDLLALLFITAVVNRGLLGSLLDTSRLSEIKTTNDVERNSIPHDT